MERPEPTPRHSPPSLLAGSLWMVAMRWAIRGIGLLSTLILARLLTPEDFGVVAMALVVVGLLEVMAWTGVDLAVIRQPDAGRGHYDTAWTIQIIQGGLISAVLLAAAPATAGFFGDPRVEDVIRALAVKPLLDGLENIGVVAFRKELRFAREFRFMVAKKLLSFAAVIGAALVLGDYRALVAGLLMGSALGALLSYAVHPYRPRLCLQERGAIWSFSQWLLISRVGLFLNRKTDQAMVGGLSGPDVMGAYYIGYEVGTFATFEVAMPVRRALFPSLSRLLDRPDALAGAFLAAFGMVALLCLPMGLGMAAVAGDFTAVVLGPQWTEAVPLMRALAVFGALAAVSAAGEVLLMATGHTRLSALESWLQLGALVPVLLWAAAGWGVEGIALARTGVALAFLPFMLYLVARWCRVPMRRQLAVLWRPAIASAAMFAAVSAIGLEGLSPVMVLALKVLAGALVYAALLLTLWILSGRPDGPEASIAAHAGALREARRRAVPGRRD